VGEGSSNIIYSLYQKYATYIILIYSSTTLPNKFITDCFIRVSQLSMLKGEGRGPVPSPILDSPLLINNSMFIHPSLIYHTYMSRLKAIDSMKLVRLLSSDVMCFSWDHHTCKSIAIIIEHNIRLHTTNEENKRGLESNNVVVMSS